MPNEQQQSGFWAIVEIFGHQRIAGFLSEQTIGGQSFVRVDVPELPAQQDRGPYQRGEGPTAAHSKLYGSGAIYSISPVDEAIAHAAAAQIRHKPVDSYTMQDALRNMPEEHRARLLSGPSAGSGHDDDDPEETFR